MNSHAVCVKMPMSCRLTCRSPTFASTCFCISIRMLIMVLLSASSAVVLPSAAWNTVTNVAYCHQTTVLAPTQHTASVADDCSRCACTSRCCYAVIRCTEKALARREWDVIFMWVSHLCGSGRYVGFVPGGVGEQRACFVGISINVIKNSDFLSSISEIWTTSVFEGSIMWIAS